MVANQTILDASLRHEVMLRRYTAGEVAAILAMLEEADADLVAKLRVRLARAGSLGTKRMQALLAAVRELRAEAITGVHRRTRDGLVELAKVEVASTTGIILEALPIQIDFVTPPAPILRALVTSQPFGAGTMGARKLSGWFADLAAADLTRLVGAIQLGVTQGEPVDDIVRRIVGTRANRYADGILAITRRAAEGVVRTAINHVSNAAREELYVANDDIIRGLRIVATLDGRTSAICQALDGKVIMLGDRPVPKGFKEARPKGERPPYHLNCRTITVPFLDEDGVAARAGERPMVRDTRTRRLRERDFRADAKAAAGDRWAEMDRAERNDAIRRVRRQWSSEAVGRVPAATTYQKWLADQPAAFQDEVLGKTRGALFRRGGLELDQFVDRRGATINLAQLARLRPDAFTAAGMDPARF